MKKKRITSQEVKESIRELIGDDQEFERMFAQARKEFKKIEERLKGKKNESSKQN